MKYYFQKLQIIVFPSLGQNICTSSMKFLKSNFGVHIKNNNNGQF